MEMEKVGTSRQQPANPQLYNQNIDTSNLILDYMLFYSLAYFILKI